MRKPETPLNRLRNTVAENEGDVITLDDARALLALVKACVKAREAMQAAGNVKIGPEADARWEEFDAAERVMDAALLAVAGGE